MRAQLKSDSTYKFYADHNSYLAKDVGLPFFKQFMNRFKIINDAVNKTNYYFAEDDQIKVAIGMKTMTEKEIHHLNLSPLPPIDSSAKLLSVTATKLLTVSATEQRDLMLEMKKRQENSGYCYESEQFNEGHINRMLREQPDIKKRQVERTKRIIVDLIANSSLRTTSYGGTMYLNDFDLVPTSQWDDVAMISRGDQGRDGTDQTLSMKLPFGFQSKIVDNDLHDFKERFVLDMREEKSIGGRWVQAKCLWLQPSVGFSYKIGKGLIAYNKDLKTNGPYATAAQPKKLIQRLNGNVYKLLLEGSPKEPINSGVNRKEFARKAMERLQDDLCYIDYEEVDLAVCQADKFRFEVALANVTKNINPEMNVA